MEDTGTQTFKDKLKSRYASRFPNVDLSDDEVLSAKIVEELDGFDGRMNKLVELFNKDPRTAEMLNVWATGGDPLKFLLETFGDDFRNALESEEGMNAFVDSHNKWLERQASDRKAKEDRDINFRQSLEALDAFKAEHNLSEQQAIDVFMKVHQIGANVIDGIYTPEDYLMAYRAMNYDNDIQAARSEGEIEGRNTRIEEHLRREDTIDELPPAVPGSGTTSEEDASKKESTVYDWGLK